MKKTIKTIVSIIAVICLIATQFVVFAEDAGTVSESTTVNIDEYMYYVGASQTTTNETFVSLKQANMIIYVLPIPETQPGKKIEKYYFSHYTGAGSAAQYIKVPQLDINSEEFSGLNLSSEGISNKISKQINKNSNKTFCAMDSVTTEELGKVIYDYTAYRNTVDLTTYMNECIEAGATEYFLLGANHYGTTAYMYSPKSSRAVDRGYYTTYTYTESDADPMTIVENVPADMATGVEASGEVYFTFSNPVKEASVLVNGKASEISILGSKVTVNETFNQYSDYTVEIDATDKYGQSVSQTITFKTGAKFVMSGDSSQFTAVHVTSSSAPTAVSRGGSDVDLRNNNFVLYKVKLPNVESGLIDSFKITYAENSTDARAYSSFFKLPGEAWDLTSIKSTDDSLKHIIDSIRQVGWASEYYAQDSASVYDTSPTISSVPLCTGDVTSYVRECLANNQTYMYLGIVSLSSAQKAHGTNSYYYNPTFTYNIIDPEFKTIEDVKIVSSDNANGYEADGLTALAKGSSYKAITSITNKTAENMTVVIAIADYDGNTLESVSFKTVEVKSGALNQLVESDAIVAASTSNKAKAFVWNSIGNEPLVKNLEVSVQ